MSRLLQAFVSKQTFWLQKYTTTMGLSLLWDILVVITKANSSNNNDLTILHECGCNYIHGRCWWSCNDKLLYLGFGLDTEEEARTGGNVVLNSRNIREVNQPWWFQWLSIFLMSLLLLLPLTLPCLIRLPPQVTVAAATTTAVAANTIIWRKSPATCWRTALH